MQPASATSLPAKGDTKDPIGNLSCFTARRTRTVVENAQVAVELLLAAQALDPAAPDLRAYPVAAGTAAAWAATRSVTPAMLGDDRWLHDDVARFTALVARGRLAGEVAAACGPLWGDARNH